MSSWRQHLRATRDRSARAVPYALLAMIVLASIGRGVGDRSAAWALLLYLPMTLIGAVAVLYDLFRRGRALPRGRFVPAVLGLIAFAFEAIHMTGLRRAPAGTNGGAREDPPSQDGTREIVLVHWNAQWGGSRRGTDDPWRAITTAIATRRPDVVVLSESPPERWVRDWVAGMPGWAVAFHDGSTGAKYRSQLAVAARWPVRHERDVRLPNGSGVIVLVDVPAPDGSSAGHDEEPRSLRVFVADGRSGLRIHRTPFLVAVAAVCDEAARAGDPVDVIAGDFNAVSRSSGFDAVRRAGGGGGGGFELASEFSGEWRGTFPTPLPLYDIDHVWVRRGIDVLDCDLFSALAATDHRGQAVRLRRR